MFPTANGILIDLYAGIVRKSVQKSIIRSLLLVLLALILQTPANAQSNCEHMATALGSGNVAGISRYLGPSVVLNITGTQATYSKSQAEMILREFFSKNTPKAYKTNMKKESPNGGYVIGTLTTSGGTFQTYFALRRENGTPVLQELRIER